MTSFTGSIRRTLGLTAARRGRAWFDTSAQHDGERFRNVKPRPVEGILAGRMVVQVLRLAVLSLLFTAPALFAIAAATH